MNKIVYAFVTIMTVTLFVTLISYTHLPMVKATSDTYGTGGAVLDVKGIPDVNGNGWPDIVAGSEDNNVYVIDGSTMEKIWSKYVGSDVIFVEHIEDISGDARSEVVIGCENGYLAVINGAAGTIIWDYTTDRGSIYRIQVIPDVDGDTISEILIGADGYEINGFYCFSGYNGTVLWDVRSSGTNKETDFTGIPDVTDNGKYDVVLANHYWGSRLDLYEGTDGSQVEENFITSMRDTLIISVPDVTGDGFSDLLLSAYVYHTKDYFCIASGVSLEVVWMVEYYPSHRGTWGIAHINDITSDGRPEVVIGYMNTLECREGVDKTSLWNRTLPKGSSEHTHSQRIAFGGSDLIVGCEDGLIYNIHPENGSLVNNQYYAIGGAVNSIEFADDMTGDDIHDILVGCEDHFIYRLDFAAMSSDAEPPEIGVPVQEPPKTNVTDGQEVVVSVSINDAGSGVFEASLLHSINDGISWENETMIGQGDIFNGTIPGYPQETMVRYKIIAYDNVGNSAVKEMPYFVYIVIPEFPAFLILPLFMIATLLAAILYRRKY